MAVIMSNLLDLGIANYAGAPIPFTDVPEWAHAYVAAMYANGITGGTSDTTYGTDDPITAVQAGLMMLKALGYFQYQGDFDANGGWVLATVRQAADIGLYDGIDAETEQQVLQNILAFAPRKTCIVTTHRPSVLEHCSRIYRIADGNVELISDAGKAK